MVVALSVVPFLAAEGPIFDARSPGEYSKAHIPGALSLPLFDDEERAAVGTCYKHQGHEAAVELGLGFVGPKLVTLVQQAKAALQQWQQEHGGDHKGSQDSSRAIRVHCWRGGMRSSSMAALLEMAGMRVALLDGGYKSFRGWVRQCVATPKPVITLGGMTGTAKTDILGALAAQGEQVLDLEGLAHHRGSSYGALGLPPQPSTEHFENLIVIAWSRFATERPVWIEAESRNVGSCRVPPELFEQMMAAPVVEIQRSQAERIEYLSQVYGESSDLAGLLAATERIRKRLGGLRTQQALDAIQRGDAATAIAIVLEYYDRTYRYDLDKRPGPTYPVPLKGLDHTVGAQQVLQVAQGAGLCDPTTDDPTTDDPATDPETDPATISSFANTH